MKRNKSNIVAILMCMMVMMFTACGTGTKQTGIATANPGAEQGTQMNQPRTTDSFAAGKSEENLEVQFIDIGQGDSILLKSKGQTMLVDAGNNEYGEGLAAYLDKLGVQKIDYLIGTHPDADHIGGLDIVINKLDIGKIYMPKKQSNTKTFQDVLTAISKKGLKVSSPTVGTSFTLGEAKVTILGPTKSYSDNNNNSIVLKVTHGKNSFLLTGDAELEAEEDMVSTTEDLSATVLKVGHHGSHSSTSQSFLKRVNPTYAVISCGVDNKYGHPHQETMTYLDRDKVEVYRTDEQKTITMLSDGTAITVKTDGDSIAPAKTNTGSNKPAVTDAPANDEDANVPGAYIGNKNTKKFHKPTCGGLPKEENQVSFSSRQEAIEKGYDPCSRCNP